MNANHNFDLLPRDHPVVQEIALQFGLKMDGSHAFTLVDAAKKPLAIAMVNLQDNGDIKINFVAADKQHPREGYATELLTRIFSYSSQQANSGQKPVIAIDGFTDEGRMYLAKKIDALGAAFPNVDVYYIPTC